MSRWPLPARKVKPSHEIHAVTPLLVLRPGSVAAAFVNNFLINFPSHRRQPLPLLDISDAFVLLICVLSILGFYFLAPIVKREMENYLARIESGEIKRFKN